MITFFVIGLEICLGNLSDDVMYNNLRKEVDALQDMMTKNQETTGVETKRIRLALDLLTNGVHKAMSKLHDKQSHLEEFSWKWRKSLKNDSPILKRAFTSGSMDLMVNLQNFLGVLKS